MPGQFKKVLFSAQKISATVSRLASEINRDYGTEPLLLVGVMKGSFIFLADLCRQLQGPVDIDFVRAKSYGDSVHSSGNVEFTLDVEQPIAGRHVIIVEDIIDSGLTLEALYHKLLSRDPASLKICTLIDKFERRASDVRADYSGLELEEGFIVGYGLDYAERYRNLPDICLLADN